MDWKLVINYGLRTISNANAILYQNVLPGSHQQEKYKIYNTYALRPVQSSSSRRHGASHNKKKEATVLNTATLDAWNICVYYVS